MVEEDTQARRVGMSQKLMLRIPEDITATRSRYQDIPIPSDGEESKGKESITKTGGLNIEIGTPTTAVRGTMLHYISKEIATLGFAAFFLLSSALSKNLVLGYSGIALLVLVFLNAYVRE